MPIPFSTTFGTLPLSSVEDKYEAIIGRRSTIVNGLITVVMPSLMPREQPKGHQLVISMGEDVSTAFTGARLSVTQEV